MFLLILDLGNIVDNMTEALLFLSHFMGDIHQVYHFPFNLFMYEFLKIYFN